MHEVLTVSQKESQPSRNESKASLHQDVKIVGAIAPSTELQFSLLFVTFGFLWGGTETSPLGSLLFTIEATG